MAALGKEAVEGFYAAGQTPFPYYDTAAPPVKAWMDGYKAKFGTDANVQAAAGYSVVLVLAEGLRHAGRDLTADSFAEGLEKVSGYQGIFDSPPVSFSRDSHLGTQRAFVAQIKGGRWVSLTDHLDY